MAPTQADATLTNDSVISQYVRPPEFAPYSLAPTQADVTIIILVNIDQTSSSKLRAGKLERAKALQE